MTRIQEFAAKLARCAPRTEDEHGMLTDSQGRHTDFMAAGQPLGLQGRETEDSL